MTRWHLLSAIGLAAAALGARESAPVTRTVTLSEFAFVGLPTQTVRRAGERESWQIRNTGRQLHEVTVLRLTDSSRLADVDAWIARGASLLLPPAEVAMHIDALRPGASVDRTIRLDSGLYVVICLVPIERRADGSFAHHASRGMRDTFVVLPGSKPPARP